MRLRPLVKGLLTFVPGSNSFLPKKCADGGTHSAEYCYGVWLWHLTMLWEHGLRSIPGALAELGPGDSLGVGLSAMLSGVNHYYALDVVRHSNPALNAVIFEELVDMFKRRAGRPVQNNPDIDSYLDGNLFPSHILTEDVLNNSLLPQRIDAIRKLILGQRNDLEIDGMSISYIAPCFELDVPHEVYVDVIISTAVLEHVDDLENAYSMMSNWLRCDGYISHYLDLRAHGTDKVENGHWKCSELMWKIITGKRPYLINRLPYSVHRDLVLKHGFEIVCELKEYLTDGIERSQLAKRWKNLSDDDLACIGAFVQAKRMCTDK